MNLSISNNGLINVLKNKDKTRRDINLEVGEISKIKDILAQDFTIFHIEELTFEDNAPRKEALENVLSAIRIDGINFVYLLLGDKSGVSFYFGIVKDMNYQERLDLDVDDIGEYILKSSIEGNFRGSKITNTKRDKNSILSQIRKMKRFGRIDGVPSINIDNENFQGVDRLVDVMIGDEFGIMVLANPLSTNEIQDIENQLYIIHNKLSPLAKESIQESEGSSETKGESNSKTNSKTDGINNSTSTAQTDGNSKGTSTTKGTTNNHSTSSSKGSSKGTSTTKGTTSNYSRNSSEGNSKGTSTTNGESSSSGKKSSSNGVTQTISINKSITDSNGYSLSDGTTQTTSTNNSTTDSNGYSSSKGITESQNRSTTTTNTDGSSTSITIGNSQTKNSSTTQNRGTNRSRDFSDKVVNEWIEYIDEVLLKRVEYGRNRGLFNMGIYIFANEKGTLLKLGNTISSLFSGTQENKAPLKLTYLDYKNEIDSIKNLQLPMKNTKLLDNLNQARLLFSKNSNRVSSWVSTNELSIIAGLPQKEVVGLSLKEEVEFGLNIKKQVIDNRDKLLLGHLVQSGSILGVEVKIDRNSLNKHIFITGVTGSGKTTTCQRILNSAQMPFMVIEPAKSEYRVLAQANRDILIFTIGDESVAPFRINPFEFFEGENITSRVDMIKANIEAAFDMEAAIPQIIESALYKCYEKYGWDISTSTNNRYSNPFADGVYAFPTLSDLIRESENVVGEQGFDDRLKNDYIGSIKARLQGLLVGSKGFMLNTPRSIDFADLVERDVILELDEIKSGAEKSLIMGFVLINLNEAIKLKYREYKRDNREFKHITLIEEAHRLLSKPIVGDNPSKRLGVETFTDMLAEVRKYGESLIIVDQIPNKLTPEVLKNTNTKIVHKLFASDDKDAIGNTMALSDEQKAFLSNLDVGRAIIYNQDFSKPLQVQIKELNNISTTKSELVEEGEIRALALGYYQQHYKRGVIQGLEIYKQKPSFDEIEELLSVKINGLVNSWEKLITKREAFNLKKYLEKNKIIEKQKFVVDYLLNRFYLNSKEDKKMIREHLIQFIDNGRDEFNIVEKAYLRSR